MPDSLTPAQIRGARGMLDWSMIDLAKAASVSVSTVKRAEQSEVQSVSDGVSRTIQAALETAGVRVLADTGEGVGLRLRR